MAILVDARGHGDSDKPSDPALYAARRLAGDVVAVLDDLGIGRADLVGFSMGGVIALATALFFPERVGRLAVVGAHCYAQSLASFRDALGARLDGFVRLIETQLVTLPEPVRRRMLANDLGALSAQVAQDRPDRSAMLASLERPLMAIAGARDPALSRIRQMADQAGGKFISLAGRNHFDSFLAVEEISRAVLGFFESRPVLTAGTER
jgi:pimeloyl-ACP methyl ester carboxylesterase